MLQLLKLRELGLRTPSQTRRPDHLCAPSELIRAGSKHEGRNAIELLVITDADDADVPASLYRTEPRG